HAEMLEDGFFRPRLGGRLRRRREPAEKALLQQQQELLPHRMVKHPGRRIPLELAVRLRPEAQPVDERPFQEAPFAADLLGGDVLAGGQLRDGLFRDAQVRSRLGQREDFLGRYVEQWRCCCTRHVQFLASGRWAWTLSTPCPARSSSRAVRPASRVLAQIKGT